MKKEETATLAAGCFWCTEAVFQRLEGVSNVISGFTGGEIKNPPYREVVTGRTGHAEGIQFNYDPKVISFQELLLIFFSTHDPTTLNRQQNDVGTQYRSVIYTTTIEQFNTAEKSFDIYNSEVNKKLGKKITTEIMSLPNFFYAEDYHQQYLAKNPEGYCGLNSLGIEFNQNDLLDV